MSQLHRRGNTELHERENNPIGLQGKFRLTYFIITGHIDINVAPLKVSSYNKMDEHPTKTP